MVIVVLQYEVKNCYEYCLKQFENRNSKWKDRQFDKLTVSLCLNLQHLVITRKNKAGSEPKSLKSQTPSIKFESLNPRKNPWNCVHNSPFKPLLKLNEPHCPKIHMTVRHLAGELLFVTINSLYWKRIQNNSILPQCLWVVMVIRGFIWRPNSTAWLNFTWSTLNKMEISCLMRK